VAVNEGELFFAPAQKGPWGVITRLAGPPNPPLDVGSTEAAAIRKADGLLRRGMILLSHESNEDPVGEAWECFRRALDILLQAVGELHPKVAYAYDRLGYLRQLRGDVREAERLYLRSIAIRDAGTWAPTMWDELTLLNLAVLYGRQGRHALQHAMIQRRREAEARGTQTPDAEGGFVSPGSDDAQ
jgi:tetratricopeptide (TPR) repeat protein